MARHGSLADQLTALRAFVTTPDHKPEPIQTNWTTVAANDNNPEEIADFGHERFLRVSPSIEEIMRSVRGAQPERNGALASEMKVCTGNGVRTVAVPGPITKWGTLRFSDGAQTERCFMSGIDGKIIKGDYAMPAGAMLGTRDELEANLGADGKSQKYVDLSNDWFQQTLNTGLPHRFIKGGKRRKGRNYTRDEAVAMLAQAKANTKVMPEVQHLPTGLPCGMKMAADAFVGMRKGKKGESGSMAWQDFATLKSARVAWREALRDLKPETKQVLEAAPTARSFAEVGGDGHKRNAEKRGRRKLIAANDDLMAVLKKFAA